MRSLFAVAALAAVAISTSTEADAEQYQRKPSWVYQQQNRNAAPQQAPKTNSYRPQQQQKTSSQIRRYHNMPAPSPTPDPTPTPDDGKHGENSSTLHLKPWEQCQTGILGTQKEFNKVEDQCKNITPAVNEFAVSFASLMQNIDMVLKPAADMNAQMIEMIGIDNAAQEQSLMTIMTDNAAIEQSISNNALSVMELEYYISLIPDISNLESRLTAMEVKQMELMMTLATNDLAIDGFNETLGDDMMGLVMEINTLSATAADQKLQIEGDPSTVPPTPGLTDNVLAVMMTAVDQGDQIVELVEAFEKQRIVSDYFTAYNTVEGSTVQMLEANMMEVPLANSCFTVMGETIDTVEKDAHFEFYFSATFNPGIGAGVARAQVYQVALVKDDTEIVAKAEYDSDVDDALSRNFAIFYKAKVDAGVMEDYQIQIWTSDAGTNPIMILENSVQWGFRVYTEEYPLMLTPPTCT